MQGPGKCKIDQINSRIMTPPGITKLMLFFLDQCLRAFRKFPKRVFLRKIYAIQLIQKQTQQEHDVQEFLKKDLSSPLMMDPVSAWTCQRHVGDTRALMRSSKIHHFPELLLRTRFLEGLAPLLSLGSHGSSHPSSEIPLIGTTPGSKVITDVISYNEARLEQGGALV